MRMQQQAELAAVEKSRVQELEEKLQYSEEMKMGYRKHSKQLEGEIEELRQELEQNKVNACCPMVFFSFTYSPGMLLHTTFTLHPTVQEYFCSNCGMLSPRAKE